MRVLLAIDGSKSSAAAVRAVARQINTARTAVRILHVVEPITAYISAAMIPHYVPHVEKIEQDRRRQAKDLVERTSHLLRRAGFRTSEAVEAGDPKTVIIDHAKKWRADLIVLGSHGWRGLGRFLMGSVSEAVARHAACSVEVVRTSTRKRTQ